MNPVVLSSYSTAHGQIAQASPPPPRAATVIGAGIVGACIALSLQRAGVQVTLLDAMAPGSLASFGNAGLISVDSCIPISLPGMLWQTPRWLLDPDEELVFVYFSDRTISVFENKRDRLPVPSFAKSLQLTVGELFSWLEE